ncbi:MAG: DNA-binding protein [Nitrospirae bacterium]|nr:DNA-binding protein [Nitrospirota bacterium]
MKYQIGKAGRIVVAKFGDREEILKSISELVKKEDIENAIFFLLGGIREGRIVVGPERDEIPPIPILRELKESHEVLGIGTIFWEGDVPKVHFHGAFGKRDIVKVGCLRDISETFLILEVIIIEIEGISAQRRFDSNSGLSLLEI